MNADTGELTALRAEVAQLRREAENWRLTGEAVRAIYRGGFRHGQDAVRASLGLPAADLGALAERVGGLEDALQAAFRYAGASFPETQRARHLRLLPGGDDTAGGAS